MKKMYIMSVEISVNFISEFCYLCLMQFIHTLMYEVIRVFYLDYLGHGQLLNCSHIDEPYNERIVLT